MPILDLIKSKDEEKILYIVFNPNEQLLNRGEMNRNINDSKVDYNLRELLLKMNPEFKVVRLTRQSIFFCESVDISFLDKLRSIVLYPLEIFKVKISLNVSSPDKKENKIVVKDLDYKNLNGYGYLKNNLFYELIHNKKSMVLDIYYYDSIEYYPREITNEFGFYALDFWSYTIHHEIENNNPKSVIWQIGQQDFAMMHNHDNIPGFYVEFVNKEYHIGKAIVYISLV